MPKQVLIGCKLPHGITLNGPHGPVTLNGMNTSRIAGGFGMTTVDGDVAAYLGAVYEDHSAFKSNAVFVSDSYKVAEIAAMARELQDEKTGFEGLDPEKPAPGVQVESDASLKKAIQQNETAPRPVKAPEAPADKAAALELAGGQ